MLKSRKKELNHELKLADSIITESLYQSYLRLEFSIVGWQEDFHLGFEVATAQKYAVSYLERTIRDENVKYQIGGHSKGGADGFEDILFAMAASDRSSKKVVGKLLQSLLVQIRQTDYRKLFRQKKVLQGMAVFFVGALCIVFNNIVVISTNVILGGFLL